MNICVRAFAGFRIGELGKWIGFWCCKNSSSWKEPVKSPLTYFNS